MINNYTLEQLSKAFNGESFTVPSYIAFSSTTKTLSPSDTSLGGELDRSVLSNTRVDNVVTFTGIRSGANVTGSGDIIKSMGLFASSTAGTVMPQALVPNVLHSSTFDLEVEWNVRVERK